MIKSIFDDEEPDIEEPKSGKASPAKRTFDPPKETVIDKAARTEKPDEEIEEAKPPSESPGKKAVDEKSDAPRGAEPVSESDLKKRLADIEAELETLQKLTPGSEVAGGVEAGESETGKKSEKEGQAAVEPDTKDPETREKSKEAETSVSQPATSETELVPGNAQPAPESAAETLRRSGMAYSAAIALFGSVLFMLMLGWFADLLLGIKPWGTVIGITLGSIIGFFQFFRITSQIFAPKASEFEQVSILSVEPDAGDQTDVRELPQPGGSENPDITKNGTGANPEREIAVDDAPAAKSKRNNP